MRIFLTNGDKVELTAPGGGVTAGLGYVVGSVFVVAESTVAAAAKFIGQKNGMVRIPKNATEALTEGQIAYWDNAAKAVRNASAAGRFIIGSVGPAQGASDLFADVLLNGIHVVAI